MENYLGIMSAAMSILVSILSVGDRINRHKKIRHAKQEYCEKVLCPIVSKLFFKAKLDDKYIRSLIENYFQYIPPYFSYCYHNNNYIDFIKIVIEDYRLLKLSKAEFIDRMTKRSMRVLMSILYCILLSLCMGYAGISVLQILILLYESDYIGICETTRISSIVVGWVVIALLMISLTIHEMNNDIYTQKTKALFLI